MQTRLNGEMVLNEFNSGLTFANHNTLLARVSRIAKLAEPWEADARLWRRGCWHSPTPMRRYSPGAYLVSFQRLVPPLLLSLALGVAPALASAETAKAPSSTTTKKAPNTTDKAPEAAAKKKPATAGNKPGDAANQTPAAAPKRAEDLGPNGLPRAWLRGIPNTATPGAPDTAPKRQDNAAKAPSQASATAATDTSIQAPSQEFSFETTFIHGETAGAPSTAKVITVYTLYGTGLASWGVAGYLLVDSFGRRANLDKDIDAGCGSVAACEEQDRRDLDVRKRQRYGGYVLGAGSVLMLGGLVSAAFWPNAPIHTASVQVGVGSDQVTLTLDF